MCQFHLLRLPASPFIFALTDDDVARHVVALIIGNGPLW